MKTLKNLSLTVMIILTLIVLIACGGNPLQDAVDEINADESMHEELSGLYKVCAEKRGESSIVVVFNAELEELATPEVSKAVSEGGASEFRVAVEEMRKARISNPQVILEFFDLDGFLIYTHIFD